MPIIPIGSELPINMRTDQSQENPNIAVDADGDFIIVWQEGVLGNKGTVARQFNADGAPISNDLSINVLDRFPDVAVDADGNAIIASHTAFGLAPNAPDVTINRLDVNNDLQNIGFVNTTKTGSQSFAAIDRNANGNFVVVWNSFNPDNNESDVYAQHFNANGTLLGSEIPLGILPSIEEFSPDVAIDNQGNFVAVWVRTDENFDGDVFAQRFSSDGTPLGNEIPVNSFTEGHQAAPAIAIDNSGNFVVTWESAAQEDEDGYGVYARRFNANGSPLGDEFLVNTTTAGTQWEAAIAMDAQGNFVITWESENKDGSDDGVAARRFSADGTPFGDEFAVNTFTAGDQEDVAIAMQPNGDFIITWESNGQDGDGEGIFAQRYQIASSIEFSQATYQVNENGSPVGATVTLNRLDEVQQRAQVRVTVSGGTATAGVDYNVTSPLTITFNPGETRKTVNIPILQDSRIEGTETLFLTLNERDKAVISNQNTAVLRILDDDSPTGGSNPGGGNNARFIRGTNRKDRLTGTNADETLVGMGKSDRIRARGGDDVLIGVNPNSRRPGRRERDKLIGNGGDDLFILGDERKVFYDDGRRKSAGLKDYALIKGFNKRQDTIQLHGKAKDYILGSSPKGKGLGLFLEGKEDELIAVIRGQINNLRLNSNAFEFV